MAPDLDDIRDGIDEDARAVWLNIGWYQYDEKHDTYQRISGHWVTVVGYVGDDLLIHDPVTPIGRMERVTATRLASGSMVVQGGKPAARRQAVLRTGRRTEHEQLDRGPRWRRLPVAGLN
ncbi:hypothetical protein [Deinococcus altitudinis]|uniref:hypothetical protein n=1 Tax=Deinococcus altitudinis TaxID=468914 RepID=UPI003892452C